MAGQPWEVLTGGAGLSGPAAASQTNANSSVLGSVGAGPQPHHGVIGLVLIALLVLVALDKLGFRFAVTAGRR